MSLLDSVKKNDPTHIETDLQYNHSQDELNACLQEAAINGFDKIVEILLKDGRADPTACSPQATDFSIDPEATLCYALQMASHNGFENIVEMLLNDGRSDPASGNYRAIKLAANAGKIGVLKKIDDYFYDHYLDYKSKIGTALASKVDALLQRSSDEKKSDNASNTLNI